MTYREPLERAPFPDGRPESEQPAWRRDFPIGWGPQSDLARRDFTKFLVLTSFAFAVGQVWIALQNLFRRLRGVPTLQAIAPLDQIPVGGARLFRYPGPTDPCLLLRPNERTLLAFDQRCTHLACAVIPDLAASRLRCPCHEGEFDAATGRPLAGPPRRPLPRVMLEIRQGMVYATGIERRTT